MSRGGRAVRDGVSTHVGTSGWQYRHWQRAFYPPTLARADWLAYYAGRFDCVEVNSSFYAMPKPENIAEWCGRTPAGFRFAVKAPRRLTHFKKLKNCEIELQRFVERVRLFGPRLGPLLFQLPPRWRMNLRRLEEFLVQLPDDLACAFEFRDPSWHDDSVYAALERRDVAFCIFDMGGETAPMVETASFVYVRLHGPRSAYTGTYRAPTLRAWVTRALAWNARGKPAYLFFDNDERGYAVKNARRTAALLADAV